MLCEIKVVEFALDLDVIKDKMVSLSKKLFLVVRFGLVNTTSNDLKQVLKITSGVFYYILFPFFE